MKRIIIMVLGLIVALNLNAQEKPSNFQKVEKEFIITKIAKTKPGTWSLSEKSDKRSYGLTSGQLYNLFGNDRVGTIGTPQNFTEKHLPGLNYTAVYALSNYVLLFEKKHMDFEQQFDIMEKENMRLSESVLTMQDIVEKTNELEELRTIIKEMEIRITELEQKVEQLENN